MIIKKLKGHSGCKVFLCESNNRKFVRKISHSVDYNDRLEAQMEKQNQFKSELIRSPKILDQGYDNEYFYFDMEYISGISLSRFITISELNQSKTIINKLLIFCNGNHDNFSNVSMNLKDKINNLNLKKSSKFEDYKAYCLDYDWKNVSTGFCHGDLSFENIIINNSEIYLIDFLDSFVESKYIDISKIFLDLLMMWSWRNENTRPFIKNILLYDHLFELISTKDMEIIKRMIILNLIRIIPYTDSQTYTIVNDAIKFLGTKFKK